MCFKKNLTPRRLFQAMLLLAFSMFSFMSLAHAAPILIDPPDKKPAAPAGPPPDVIIFTNGDQLSGTFVNEVEGKVTFHSDILGDVTVPWEKIKELHTKTKLAILTKANLPHHRTIPPSLPQGTVSMENSLITVHPENNATIQPIPIASAPYIVDEATLHKQVYGHPGFFQAWNGSATAGATIVQATQKSYNFSGAVGLVRVVPSLTWLDPRNRTAVDFLGSYGKITQPAFVSGGVFYPPTNTKTSIYHADIERDQYFTPRMYVLGLGAWDHNYGQLLDLQQIYGGGLGYTLIKDPKQELDVKGTIQYEHQAFFDGTTKNLIGSTFAAIYNLALPHDMTFNQQVAYIPAYNDASAYSVTESNLLAIPAYKNLSFSFGTLDSYLNDPPAATPPTKRNSFQVTLGLTYAIKSTY